MNDIYEFPLTRPTRAAGTAQWLAAGSQSLRGKAGWTRERQQRLTAMLTAPVIVAIGAVW